MFALCYLFKVPSFYFVMHAGFFFIVGWTSDYDPRKEAPETSRWRSKVKMNIFTMHNSD